MKRGGIKSKKRLAVETQSYRRVLTMLAIAAFGSTAALAQQAEPNGAPPPAAGESSAGAAADVGEQPEEIVVFGRDTQAARHGRRGERRHGRRCRPAVRPLLRVAELLEAVPGLVAVQHSGSGKANQYFLRGFNLDHGTDFTTYVDGMPWNLRSHGHGQGYLDVNGLMPEIGRAHRLSQGRLPRATSATSRWPARRSSRRSTRSTRPSSRSRAASTAGVASRPAARTRTRQRQRRSSA